MNRPSHAPGRPRLLLVYGGRSSEHEVSVRSAAEVAAAVDRARFDLHLLAIGRDGRFYRNLNDTSPAPDTDFAEIAGRGEPVADLAEVIREADVVFPLLHGPWGEDGTFQGLLEVLGVPYVGSGVLASALCMDKAAFKIFVASPQFGVPVTPGLHLELGRNANYVGAADQALEAVGVPCFVKPANQGSSVGVSKVEHPDDMEDALRTAAEFDPRVVVEKAIDAREIELAVLGNGGPETVVSGVGEITLPEGRWYDYEAKYVNDSATLHIPADCEPELVERLREVALAAFRAVGAKGLARIDFLVDRQSGEVYLNEVNTMPGFTTISMYPKLMAHCGIDYGELIARLCELAFEQHATRAALALER